MGESPSRRRNYIIGFAGVTISLLFILDDPNLFTRAAIRYLVVAITAELVFRAEVAVYEIRELQNEVAEIKERVSALNERLR
ncbi:hypothetical protein [Halobaculum sp. MBLA0143]|uniref:hypothetical protein n=1 Tax=Halobaculum sp. MBLA0143 TaxID=3079933 RepID=UPI003524D9A0